MPYKLSEIAARFNVNYLPIVSSGRAFRALWKRAYHKVSDLMAAVVYEDPWLAGGRSEEHTSELQSLMRISYAVFCLKKKNTQNTEYREPTTTQTEHDRIVIMY